MIILDQSLQLLHEKTYLVRETYAGFGDAVCSIVDNQGNIVLTSFAVEEENKDRVAFTDFAFYKFNPLGDTLLSRYYSYIHSEFTYELTKVPNSDDLMLIERATLYNNHIELMYLDKDLNILKVNQLWSWEVSLGGDVSCDYWLSDTEFLVSGRIGIETGGSSDHCIGVYRVDTAANFLQELLLNKVDTTDYPAKHNSMAYANDSTIYIGGFQNIMGFWNTEPSIVELYMIDKDMNLLGYKELGGDYNYELWGIIATQDDGCLLYGTRLDVPEPKRDIQIWKVLRDDINIITGVSELPAPALEIAAYPNPVSDKLFVELSGTASWNHNTLCIYNIDGRQVFRKRIQGEGNLLQADVSNLGPGHYIISIEQNNKNIYTTKIVKQ
ncbi:MAG: T9SS type A sorting domain-containing protein [Bacteroidales bacterium]